MLLLHPNLACLTKCVANEASRHSITAVKVSAITESYRIEATDGRIAARVDGNTLGDKTERYESIPALMAAPNGATQAMVLAKEFEKAMKDAPKVRHLPELSRVAVVMGEHVTTLGTTDLETNLVRQPKNVEGRFPQIDNVIPDGAPVAKIRVNATMLAKLLLVAAEFTPEADANDGVIIELHGNKPIVIRTENGSQTFTGLAVPLSE